MISIVVIIDWIGCEHTRRHVECRATAKVGSQSITSGKSKVSELHSETVVLDQDVLRLEVPVEDLLFMTILHGTEDLQENLASLCVVLDVVAFLGDLGKQVAFRAVLKDNKGAVPGVNDLVHGDHTVMLAGKVMKLDLTLLEFPLPGIESSFFQCLDGVQGASHDIAGLVDRSVCSDAKDVDQFDIATKDRSNPAV